EENNSATYNMPVALQLSGDLNTEALQRSLHWLQERHSSLRTCFPEKDGQATVQVQEVEQIAPLLVHHMDDLSGEALRAEIRNRADSHAVAPFDIEQGPLFKAELLRVNDREAVLLLNMHHIISDGWSMGVFVRDWQDAYTAFAQGGQPSRPRLAIQYSDYAAWQRNWLQGEVLQRQAEYWRGQLAGIPELLELPADRPRPPRQSYQGAQYSRRLSAELSEKITALSRKAGVSDFMTLLAVFNLLLSRYSRQDDICVGSPIANRTHSQTEDVIGFFVNTLVLRSRPEPNSSFTDFLLDIRQPCLEAYAHQDIPFEMLVEQLQPARSLSHHPLFQVMFVLQNNESSELKLSGLDVTMLEAEYPVAKFDLTLSMEEQDGRFCCVWEYATDLFEAETVERMAEHFEMLLHAVVDNPKQSVSQLPMLTKNEVQQLQTWNDTATEYPADKTIVDLFEEQVEKTPDNIAVVFPSAGSGHGEEQQLTYAELNQQSNQLACYLLNLKDGSKHSTVDFL
ncbi:MAG: non-ribosomal peptide synthetase, partial [Candidatus Electrothrix sp. MAN1_4]|nr:non-ribosomal peptide synthetase [Candidatus Electrothrix sp. MAN1_4]